jgi:hypothetical protein
VVQTCHPRLSRGIGRIMVQGQPGQKFHNSPCPQMAWQCGTWLPSRYTRSTNSSIAVQNGLGIPTPYLKSNQQKRTEDVAQVVEQLSTNAKPWVQPPVLPIKKKWREVQYTETENIIVFTMTGNKENGEVFFKVQSCSYERQISIES